MRIFGKWLGRVLLALLLAVVVIGFVKRDEIARLWTVNTLFDPDRIVYNFSHMGDAFPTVPLSRGDGPVSTLPKGERMDLPRGTQAWIDDRAVTSLVVLKDGVLRYEDYYLDTGAEDLRISWSVAKSYLSALFGVLLNEGAIDSLDDPVTKYAPELKDTAYDGASLRNVLNMASGVTFDEDYFDPKSDINRMGRVIALGGTLDGFTTSFFDRHAEPGVTWQYVSIDTHVIGMVIRGATGRDIPDLLSEKILSPLGQEQAGYYLTDGQGTAFVLGGLNSTTRDFARFALMFEQEGRYGDVQVVPSDWVAQSTMASAPTQPGKIGYGFQ